MITYKILTNKILIKSYLQKDYIYKNILGISTLLYFEPNDTVIWALVYKKSQPIGILAFTYFDNNIIKFDGGLYKAFRHQNTVELLLESLNKIKLPNTNYNTKFMTTVETTNIICKKLLIKAGFQSIKTTQYNNKEIEIFSEV